MNHVAPQTLTLHLTLQEQQAAQRLRSKHRALLSPLSEECEPALRSALNAL